MTEKRAMYWWLVAGVFTLIGFWVSMFLFIGWPLVFLSGLFMAYGVRQNNFSPKIHLPIVIGLVLGGLPMWLTVVGSGSNRWRYGLAGDAITGLLYLLGVGCYHLYIYIRSPKKRKGEENSPAGK